jgi:hypothetical protein
MIYAKTIIYKIVCNDLNIKEVYVGSTCNFIRRKCAHKTRCNNINDKSYNQQKYKFIRDNGGWSNWSMLEIEKYPCNDKNESHTRERYWIETLNSTLNKYIPTRTNKEYYEDNKHKISDYHKQHYDETKEKVLEQQKEYYKLNKEIKLEKQKVKYTCDCGSICRIHAKQQHFRSKKHMKYLEQNK